MSAGGESGVVFARWSAFIVAILEMLEICLMAIDFAVF